MKKWLNGKFCVRYILPQLKNSVLKKFKAGVRKMRCINTQLIEGQSDVTFLESNMIIRSKKFLNFYIF